ncbi:MULTISPECIES: aldo/keto reductase [Haloferax]|uniref:Oxidoreductase n=3 Tax=Haloferax TaxID=2251 RepID=M0I2M5_9EURY|nr:MULTISPECIES: aldo/keto reductase [Haloferax]ELZ91020.1 oxidoreductase [Haloferax sulfurifontis ATCC BAA-897]MDS0241082.1 aldo/keto reductase [Haloferax sp. S2CR25]MDS0444203.1 aldo/keto reductase [Haloferax sp. S2CR25-2]CQR49467.1 L-glyceraldehyde 3-phosphate reductase [Haloferax massiliensis]GGC44204.1 oxidoreductase [Haloferax sulfurifontis]
MQTRALGDTGHESTIATFGAIALNWLEQEGANQMVEHVLSKGVNHFDVAPTYGDAELKLGPKLRQHREDIFLGCKTQERGYEGAKRKLDRSFDRLGVDYIDLYQVHGLEYESELDEITADDGALAAFREAKDEGKIGHIGLTSHGNPGLIRDAIDRIDDLETLMFPLNPVVVGKGDDEHDYAGVFEAAEKAGIGTLGIKAFARGPWPDTDDLPEADRPFANWYEPVDAPDEIAERFDFAAAQGLTSVVTPGDPKLVAMVLDAATRYNGMDETAQRSLIERLRHDESPVPEQLHH